MAQQLADVVIKNVSDKFLAGSKTTTGLGVAIAMLAGVFTAFASDTNSNFQEAREAARSEYRILNADIKQMKSEIAENKVLILRSESRIIAEIRDSREVSTN